MKKRIAIIGCGKMGEAILCGLISKKYISRNNVFVSDKSISRLKAIKNRYKVHIEQSNIDACAKSDVIILSVKPQDMQLVLEQLSGLIKDKLVISIAAGKTIVFIKEKSGARRIVRAMPNTPALAGHAITALAYIKGLPAADRNKAESIFNCIGKTVSLDEKYMDAVTAVSGSGPAYVFLLMEQMARSAISLGIKKNIAYKLVTETVFGASFLQQSLGRCPASLREDVTSKGGTTEAALKVFKEKGFDRIVEQAMTAAFKKSRQMR